MKSSSGSEVSSGIYGEPLTRTVKSSTYCSRSGETRHLPGAAHETGQHANNRAGLSHQPTRVRERVMRRFKSMFQAQRFVSVHAAISNLFNLGRHLIAAAHYRTLRQGAFVSWDKVVAI